MKGILGCQGVSNPKLTQNQGAVQAPRALKVFFTLPPLQTEKQRPREGIGQGHLELGARLGPDPGSTPGTFKSVSLVDTAQAWSQMDSNTTLIVRLFCNKRPWGGLPKLCFLLLWSMND